MQISKVKDNKADNIVYLRSKVDDAQQMIIDKLRLKIPNDTTPQKAINQYFIK
jgi:hypothetical protein